MLAAHRQRRGNRIHYVCYYVQCDFVIEDEPGLVNEAQAVALEYSPTVVVMAAKRGGSGFAPAPVSSAGR